MQALMWLALLFRLALLVLFHLWGMSLLIPKYIAPTSRTTPFDTPVKASGHTRVHPETPLSVIPVVLPAWLFDTMGLLGISYSLSMRGMLDRTGASHNLPMDSRTRRSLGTLYSQVGTQDRTVSLCSRVGIPHSHTFRTLLHSGIRKNMDT
jgi:hypothetical protein